VTDRTAELKAWLDGRADELATLLEALVRVPTENLPGRELGRCAGVLRDAMERLGFSPELIELAPTGGVIWHACRAAPSRCASEPMAAKRTWATSTRASTPSST